MTCPICFNSISSNTRLRGADGVDEYGDPTPFWTDDPLLTPTGFAGSDYIGISPIRYIHIKELQSYYSSLEIAIGISDPTEFIEPFDRDPIVIVQLRISVEKILTAIGMTISDYFKSDRHGNLIETTQTDWTDVDRSEGIPNLSPNYPIRACHIEELRRGIKLLSQFLFCDSGWTYKTPMGYGNVSSGSQKFFNKFVDMSVTGWVLNNTFEHLHFQDRGIYLFSCAPWLSWGVAPVISWNTNGNLGFAESGTYYGNGLPNQEYYAYEEDIPTPIPVGCEVIIVDSVIWTRVTDFSSSSPTDQHYVIDYEDGILYFGDGDTSVVPPVGHGLPPPDGAMIILSIGGWEGFLKEWDYDLYKVQFDPPLPVYDSEYTEYEGINGVTVDDSGEDYLMYTTEFFYSRIGEITPEDWGYISYFWEGFPNYIAKYKYPKERIIGTSNGTEYQYFVASSFGIKIPMIEYSDKVYVGGVVWTRVDDFFSSGPSDKHYTIDYDTGTVSFGNGKPDVVPPTGRGLIPPTGAEIKMFVTLQMGGIWEFVEIAVPRENNNYYSHIQARNGKLWYACQTNPFYSYRAKVTQVNSTMVGRHTEYWEHGYKVSETWLYDYAYPGVTSDQVLVESYGSFQNVLGDTTVIDKSIFLDVPTGGWIPPAAPPNVLSDNPESARIEFVNKIAESKQVTTNSIRYDYVVKENAQIQWSMHTQFISALRETIHYGYVYENPPGSGHWVFVSDTYSALTFSLNRPYDNPDFINGIVYPNLPGPCIIQIGDQIRGYGSTDWDAYAKYFLHYIPGGYYNFFYYWEIDNPIETPVIRSGTQWTIRNFPDDEKICFYKVVPGITERLSETVPLKVVFQIREDDPRLGAFGVSSPSDYTCTYEVISLTEV